VLAAGRPIVKAAEAKKRYIDDFRRRCLPASARFQWSRRARRADSHKFGAVPRAEIRDVRRVGARAVGVAEPRVGAPGSRVLRAGAAAAQTTRLGSRRASGVISLAVAGEPLGKSSRIPGSVLADIRKGFPRLDRERVFGIKRYAATSGVRHLGCCALGDSERVN
jgi:hypothetical protein